MDVVIYARYSSSNQREESIEAQLAACHRYAKANNYKVIDEYVDRAATGRNAKRPALQKLIKDSESGDFERVLIYQFDRFMRDRYLSQHYKKRLKEQGVRVVSVTQSIGEGAESILTEGFHEAFDEYYSAQLSERITAGQAINAEKCRFNGGSVPFGYRIDDDGFFQIDEETAPIVQRIFKEYAEGRPIADMIRDLNAAGYRNVQGNEYNRNSFKNILSNQRYLGIYIFGGHIIEGGMPQLIDEELFNVVQLRVNENKRPNRANRDYLLTGYLYCGECKSLMVGTSGTSKSGNLYHYYACKKALNKGSCHKTSVRKDLIEDLVIAECRKLLTDENIDSIASKVAELCKRELQDDAQIEALQKHERDLKKKIDKLIDRIEDSDLSDLYEERLAERKTELDEVKTQIAEKLRNRVLLDEDEIAFFLTSLRDGSADKPGYRKALVAALINKIYLYDDHLIVHFTTSSKKVKVTVSLQEEAEAAAKAKEPPPKSVLTGANSLHQSYSAVLPNGGFSYHTTRRCAPPQRIIFTLVRSTSRTKFRPLRSRRGFSKGELRAACRADFS